MTIRIKILSISLAFLVIFGIVIIVSTVLQHRLSSEVHSTFQYNTPVRTLISDFDVLSDEYELIVLRLVRRTDAAQAEIEREIARARKDAERMSEDLRQVDVLMEQAMTDERLPEQSRLLFSGMIASLPFIERHFDPFIQTGEQVLQAIAEGRFDDARTLSLEFRETENAFGPDTAAIRQKLATVQESLTDQIKSRVTTIEYLSFGLFALAACLGIGVGAIVAANIVRTLRRLIEGAQAVQEGKLTVVIPIASNDEVGQLAAAFNRMVVEIRAKERIQDAFGKFVDPRIVAGLVSEAGDIEHADRQVVTVFFSDIAGFTSISEQLTATAIVNLLNHYFAAVTGPIRANNGIVDKLMGDGIMAFWSPPFSPADTHAVSACLSALTQQEAIGKLNQDLPNISGLRRNAPAFTVRMGIATGEVVLGTIGSTDSKSFTVIGDTVNLASRLEGVNKIFGTRIIVAESTLRSAEQAVESRELDLITVVGKTEPVRIYELLCPAGKLKPEEAELIEEFHQGLGAYRAREWDAAERQFQRCLKINPRDAPSALYVDRIVTYRKDAPPADWDGVWRLTLK
ncbi:MAG TPA: adenylate/guanylate cyclase domain-containing protein [Pirellulales bacterium]|jgi:adenylate cyclase|nr:adenylate/guanylate cyclase domain-containing protein [Pirellulales bacterium]